MARSGASVTGGFSALWGGAAAARVAKEADREATRRHSREAGGLLRTSTRPTLNLLLHRIPILRDVSHAPISVECLLSMTLMQGAPPDDGVGGHDNGGGAT